MTKMTIDEEDLQFLFDCAYGYSQTLYPLNSHTWSEVTDKIDRIVDKTGI